MPVISFSIESELLKRFEKLLEKEGFNSKSEAFRVAIRDFIHKYEFPEIDNDQPVEIIIGFSYIDTLKIRNRLTKIQHDYLDQIKETLHRHVFNNICYELIIVQGTRNELQPLINQIRSTRGIESFHLSTFSATNQTI